MPEDFLPIDGIVVPASALSLERSRALAEILATGALPFARLVECRTVGSISEGSLNETIVLEVDVERPQKPVHDIRHTERLGITFKALKRWAPEVVSLRSDFPWVPHLNISLHDYPRSLCLYEEPWSEVSSRWTPAIFIERIRAWLAATARGELHQDDQPLEPLLLPNGLRVILPADICDDLGNTGPSRLDFFVANGGKDCRTLIASRPLDPKKATGGLKVVGTTFLAEPQQHGLIKRAPTTLGELHAFLLSGGIDLITALRQRLGDWEDANVLSARLAIIVALPLTRVPGGPVERFNLWVFASLNTIRDVRIDIGTWVPDGGTSGLLLAADESRRGNNTNVEVLSPYLEFGTTAAASANALTPDKVKVVGVGAGALGSQVIATLYRTGFGDWTVVDQDDLLPHNLARHVLTAEYVGSPKAQGLAFFLNTIYAGNAKAIVADVLYPDEQRESLEAAYKEADLILDMSASATVAQHLANDVVAGARRMSVFMNPQGTDVVLLAEDKDRGTTLDALEAQYYRAVLANPKLNEHMASNDGRIRYGRSCRDLSTTMSTHLVSTAAAFGGKLVRQASETPDASICVLRCDPITLEVTTIRVAPESCQTFVFNGWTLIVDHMLLARLSDLRANKLPNETGGVLLGMYDLKRKRIHVVDTIPSRPDSAEWPTLYIRGSEGLLPMVQSVMARTGGQLEYVGEWHSHPDHCDTRPSEDDMKVFGWLTTHMAVASLPALMAIVGERGSSSWFLGEMLRAGGWTVTA